MRLLLQATLLLGLLTLPLVAQNEKPFQLFDNRVKEERAGFAGDKGALSAVFNTERIRLGDKFESELLIYLADDVEKHYWLASFLRHPSYLHGNKPLPHLALLLKQQALSLLHGKTDRDSLGYVLKLSVTAAVLSEELGLRVLAEFHRKDAERVLASDSYYSAWFPGMSEYDRCLYDSISKQNASLCQRDVTTNRAPLRCPIRGGFVDRRAISKPAAIYPEVAKAQGISGVVTVQILINEEGKVEDATADSGHHALQEAAMIAARQARFEGTRLSGKPVKVCGVLTYNFKR